LRHRPPEAIADLKKDVAGFALSDMTYDASSMG
jgi:hypothetical protein